MATLVTGYVRLNSQHRSHDRYLQLGRRLIGLGLPTVAFYDGHAGDLVPTPKTTVRPAALSHCWMARHAATCSPPPGSPMKDTTAYCVVQHQKTSWLAEAARLTGDHVVWVDFGVFHLPASINDRTIREFFARVDAANPDRITIPGIWPMVNRPMIDWTRPAWYVAGGVVIVPPDQAEWFHDTTVTYATLQMEASGQTTWEVNTWSAMLRDHRERFCVYAADHNETLFTGYGGPTP